MKKKILLVLITVTLMFIGTFNIKAASIDYGECIKKYPGSSIKYVGSGNNHYNAIKTRNTGKTGNVDFSKGNHKWTSNPVTFTFDVQANLKHSVNTIMYSLGSCSGEITGFPKDKANVKFSVVIAKGYIVNFTVWGTQKKDSNGNITGIRKETQSVKYYNEKDDPVTIDENKDGQTIGQKVKCDSFDKLLSKYWSWIIILAPILAILLISFDLVTVIISNDADKMKKVGNNSVKRMAALIILLFLPYLLEWLFGLFGFSICL